MIETRTRISLRDISEKTVRNYLRGLQSAEAGSIAARKTVERLRDKCSPGDARKAFSLIFEHPIHGHHFAPSDFPDTETQVSSVPFLKSGTADIELAIQGVLINRNKDKLAAAITELGKLNHLILAKRIDEAVSHFETIRSNFGISLYLTHKANSLRHSLVSDEQRQRLYQRVVAPLLSPNRNLLAVAFEDSVDTERDYISVRRSFIGFVKNNQISQHDRPIISEIFSPIFADDDSAANRIQAYGRWGALDSLAHLMRLYHIANFQNKKRLAAAIRLAIPEELWDLWRKTFNQVEPDLLLDIFGNDDQFFEERFFAHTHAWSEYPEIIEYRLRIESAVGSRSNNSPPYNSAGMAFVQPAYSAAELLSFGKLELQLTNPDPKSCGAFHRTIALVASIENGGLVVDSGEQLASLLDQTLNVATLLTRGELTRFLKPKPDDELYEFLRSALIFDQENSKPTQHRMRRTLQLLAERQFSGDLVSLLDHLKTENGHVAAYLYNSFTEPFLTELYDLFDEADDVSEAHVAILEWQAKTYQDEDARTRAKSHRLSQLLRKVRGSIDETRIYVDPLRFLEWISEHKSANLRALSLHAEEILSATEDATSISLRNPVQNEVQPKLRLLKELDECYSEFCTNKFFGITSYVGRRIRHGTLYGHLVLEFKPEVTSVINQHEFSSPRFTAHLASWMRKFDSRIQEVAAEELHVRSKDKPNGLIEATLNDHQKLPLANSMANEIALRLRDHAQLTASMLSIHEYCWRIFEFDLRRCRDALEQLRRDFLLDPDHRWHNTSTEDTRQISASIRQLNSSLQQRFEVVRSWLTRPTSASPSATMELLFNAVLDEIYKRYAEFEPNTQVLGDCNLELIGHRFHYFYDALFILVDNAAKHGAPDGQLIMNVTSKNDDSYMYWTVSVTSDLAKGKEAESRENIEHALVVPIDDAITTDVNSGIKKLRGLVSEADELLSLTHSFDGTTVTFEFDLRLNRG